MTSRLYAITRNNALVNGWSARRWSPERFAGLQVAIDQHDAARLSKLVRVGLGIEEP